MRTFLIVFAFLVVLVISIAGFRGSRTERPPLEIFPDMVRQNKFSPQGENPLFRNRMDDRLPVEGTIMRGDGREPAAVFRPDYENLHLDRPEVATGKHADGSYVEAIPIPISFEMMERGRRKYDIFCKVCHGAYGQGDGVTQYHGIVSANLQTSIYLERPDGNLFEVITEGYNTMMSYRDKLTVEERWAVVLYMRALQQMYHANEDDLTPEQRRRIGL